MTWARGSNYIFSGWDVEKMVQQLREAIAVKPDGIAMMGHPGDAAIMPLAEEAASAGIKMMYQNVPVPKVIAKFGGGYVGAQVAQLGRALGAEVVRRAESSPATLSSCRDRSRMRTAAPGNAALSQRWRRRA